MIKNYSSLVEQVREKRPLIHHITNYVTVNDCANITLGIGASPIMADDLEEVKDIVSISQALVLNMGTLNERSILSMIAAGKAANDAGIPVVFDPVGAGASKLRNKTAEQIVNEIRLSVVRGNSSEIRFLAGLQSETKGVDASDNDQSSVTDTQKIAKELAQRMECVVVVTGMIDVISDGSTTVCIENGHPLLSCITGTGCMCTSLIGSYCGAAPDTPFVAAVAALLTMGVAGEIAFEQAGAIGNGSFRIALHDAVSRLHADELERRAKIYEARY